ncbi:hypothetical protein BT96DRAFT_1019024 [Gymnopus androsaceus JB14]|uniref:Uncharacterized protein n=1 Tax=Gymnopus androsaceus JB14 TaxID=1447944 RepID=A0A6A4HSA8_9AGAR|nr:hypothetical protein BT96DRAFT_1019024 [Gymnopus androsaceus JB14]
MANSEVEDEGSLFGSPPSSPRIGRSPSPALALPSSSESIVNLQNVGTIALPGSHHHSELPMHPLALPLNCDAASRPPAFQSNSRFASLAPTSTPSSPSSSRASSQAPRKKQCRRRRDDEPIVRLPPPEIPLPDPAAPPPPNWLRSQSALLGHAGLVGGVKPALLSIRHARGSTAVNPIDVDVEHVPPPKLQPQPQQRFKPIVYPDSELPTHSTEEIVQILIKQRDVFPILQDILKLKQRGSFGSTRSDVAKSDPPSSPSGPALKKRKLNKVPAGAADWDVPYPFQPGEGPQAYSARWERDRERQLILRLASLIRSASRKAAIRKYIQMHQQLESQTVLPQGQTELSSSEIKALQHSLPKVDGHYRPETVFYGLPNVPSQDILADASHKYPSSSASASPAPESSPLDGLLASLVTLAQSSDQGGASSSDFNSLFTFNLPGPIQQSENASQGAADLLPEFGSWNGFPDAQGSFSYSPDPSSSLFSVDVDGHVPAATDMDAFQSHLGSTNPTQLNISIPSTSFTPGNLSAFSGPPSLTHSPIPSSFGDAELLTPVMQGGELGPPAVSIATDQNEDGILSLLNGIMGLEGPQGPDYLAKTPASNTMDVQLSSVLPALVSSVCVPLPASAGTSSVFKPPTVRPFHPTDRTMNKTELLKRARERRAQLAEEVVKARMQLWETTNGTWDVDSSCKVLFVVFVELDISLYYLYCQTCD